MRQKESAAAASSSPCFLRTSPGLDTSTGIVSQGRFSDDDSWLAKCDDINYFNGKVACLRKDTSFACAVDLIVDDVSADTLVMDSCEYLSQPIANWLNNHIRTNVLNFILSDLLESIGSEEKDGIFKS